MADERNDGAPHAAQVSQGRIPGDLARSATTTGKAIATASVGKKANPASAKRQRAPAQTDARSSQSAATLALGQSIRQAWFAAIPAWVLAPLRLFLGVTFLYAGLQKLTDPQYFNPHAVGYIGKQIAGFAAKTPLHGFLVGVAEPHAIIFGALVASGELAIGAGTLLGVLARPAAFFGALLNLLFFLSASWRIFPYFYGSDIVFLFAWTPLLLAGPEGAALPTVDAWLAARYGQAWLARIQRSDSREWVASLATFLLGVRLGDAPEAASAIQRRGNARRGQAAPRYANAEKSRRDFIWGAVAGGAAVTGLFWLFGSLGNALLGTANTPGETTPVPGAGTSSGASTTLGEISAIPTNSATTFTIPSNQDPGVLIHLQSGKFVAFDATCTHAGCAVQYDPGSRLLICPCHGAEFDPSQGANVVAGPAPTPLTSLSITVDTSTNQITLNG